MRCCLHTATVHMVYFGLSGGWRRGVPSGGGGGSGPVKASGDHGRSRIAPAAFDPSRLRSQGVRWPLGVGLFSSSTIRETRERDLLQLQSLPAFAQSQSTNISDCYHYDTAAKIDGNNAQCYWDCSDKEVGAGGGGGYDCVPEIPAGVPCLLSG